jgi:hypothetical protein
MPLSPRNKALYSAGLEMTHERRSLTAICASALIGLAVSVVLSNNSAPCGKNTLCRKFYHYEGYAYRYPSMTSFGKADTDDDNLSSTLEVYENGVSLGPAHVNVHEIGRLGRGSFIHRQNQIFLSASDNSDPNTNGRTYTVFDPKVDANLRRAQKPVAIVSAP